MENIKKEKITKKDSENKEMLEPVTDDIKTTKIIIGEVKMEELKKESVELIEENIEKTKLVENKEDLQEKKTEKSESTYNKRRSQKPYNAKNANAIPNFSKAQIYKKNIEEETIFNVEVEGAKRDEKYGDIMLFKLNDTKGIVSKDEADDDIKWNSLISFIGNEISVVIKEYDVENDRLICSRKEAQKIIKSKIISELSANDEVKARITKLTYFGAYVEIHGVSGILKNEEFSNDHISVGDVFKAGDVLLVQLLRVNHAGKLFFKVPVLYKKSSMIDLKDYEIDQVVKGPVISVKEWGFYVRLLPGIDILVPLPRDEEVFVGSNAVVKLAQIFDDKNNLRLRGRLIKFLSF